MRRYSCSRAAVPLETHHLCIPSAFSLLVPLAKCMPFPACTQLNCSTSSLPQKHDPWEAKLPWNPENKEDDFVSSASSIQLGKKCFTTKSKQINETLEKRCVSSKKNPL